MNNLQLIFPNQEHKLMILDYKNEFILNNDSMDGSSGLRDYNDYNEWLDKLNNQLKEETTLKNLVPSTTLLAIRKSDNKMVGIIDIRHKLNNYLFNFGGHIGYSIRKSERRKGYAKEMLNLALAECKKLNIDKILITCDSKNIGSYKTILGNNGVLENEIPENDRVTQRYWINLI